MKTNSIPDDATYIIIQSLVIKLLQLALVRSELDSVQHFPEQQHQSIFVPKQHQHQTTVQNIQKQNQREVFLTWQTNQQLKID